MGSAPPTILLICRERVALLELLAGVNRDVLAVVDLHVGALEGQPVLAAGDLVVDDGGVLAVDPDLGPRYRVHGDAAVATRGGRRRALLVAVVGAGLRAVVGGGRLARLLVAARGRAPARVVRRARGAGLGRRRRRGG